MDWILTIYLFGPRSLECMIDRIKRRVVGLPPSTSLGDVKVVLPRPPYVVLGDPFVVVECGENPLISQDVIGAISRQITTALGGHCAIMFLPKLPVEFQFKWIFNKLNDSIFFGPAGVNVFSGFIKDNFVLQK